MAPVPSSEVTLGNPSAKCSNWIQGTHNPWTGRKSQSKHQSCSLRATLMFSIQQRTHQPTQIFPGSKHFRSYPRTHSSSSWAVLSPQTVAIILHNGSGFPLLLCTKQGVGLRGELGSLKSWLNFLCNCKLIAGFNYIGCILPLVTTISLSG